MRSRRSATKTVISKLRRSWALRIAIVVAISAIFSSTLLRGSSDDRLPVDFSHPISIHGLALGLDADTTKELLNVAANHEFPWWSSRKDVVTSFEHFRLCRVTGYCVKQNQSYLHSGADESTVLAVLGRPQWVSSHRGEPVWVYQCSDGYLEVYWDYYLLGWFDEPRVAMYFTLSERSEHVGP